ncbi:MAG TPA: hypothetical protein DEO54_10415 [Rikenellaceae bacterium]|nr:MAG: hypothetical protein A2X20_06365 [Bacteroidetes bacterium GWE2_40_15]HBZ26623.1 hypothetical protein [Rikenellaceae bacterium]
MSFSTNCNNIFDRCVNDYHKTDNVETPISNPYSQGTLEWFLYSKNWIDAVQWHLEDIIREPGIDPVDALAIKRRIDSSNQERTDMVEMIDSYFMERFSNVKVETGATINTETPAWAIDRLSILALKIYHMRAEALRADASESHRNSCKTKLDTLLTQREDLSTAIDNLLNDIESGRKYMKFYKQMKMYNDPSLNPVLYAGKKA